MKKAFPLFDIYWDDNDIKQVTKVIKRGSYWAIGPEVKEFENMIKDYFNIKYVVSFNSGTSALHAVLLAYNITSGEVIVPSMSFISTANCVLLAGATPIFAEIEKDTLGLDSDNVKEKITKKTKAIIPMHYGGMVCKNIERLKELAEQYNLILIEDNAESFGAKINEKLAGTFGNASMLSFCQNKIITTGEGGAICTNNKEIFEKLILIRSHGRVEQSNLNYFTDINEMDYIQIGYNFRMPSMNAALGISQLSKIKEILTLRRKIGKYYDNKIDEISDIEILKELNGQENVYQLYSILLKNPEKKKELQQHLLKNGIYSKVYFYPIHLKSFYRTKFGYKKGYLSITEEISNRILSLPISLRFNTEEQDYIIETLKQFFK